MYYQIMYPKLQTYSNENKSQDCLNNKKIKYTIYIFKL